MQKKKKNAHDINSSLRLFGLIDDICKLLVEELELDINTKSPNSWINNHTDGPDQGSTAIVLDIEMIMDIYRWLSIDRKFKKKVLSKNF